MIISRTPTDLSDPVDAASQGLSSTTPDSERRFFERQTIDRLLAHFSSTMNNPPGDRVEDEIERALKRLVEFLGIDRSSFGEFLEDGTLSVLCSTAAEGVESMPRGPVSPALNWYMGELRAGRPVVLPQLPHDLPAEAVNEVEFCERSGIHSSLSIPLQLDGRVFGCITFAAMHGPRVWPDDLIARLKVIGEVFAQALARSRIATRLAAALTEIERLRQRLEVASARPRKSAGRLADGPASRSPRFNRVLDEVRQVAPTGATVLLLGETGTGKELLAEAIHELSGRNQRPLVKINCSALPATLIEAELFGRERGAYTGALARQIGRFELADGATLFLDEIGDLPLELQPKLLRVLQTGEFERLGSSETRRVDVRIIAATNRDLQREMQQGRFRDDLYYRLGVFPIEVPPLRERREDIPLLASHLAERKGRQLGKPIAGIARAALDRLTAHDWPGNVRELENAIERAVILARGRELGPAEFPGAVLAMEDTLGSTSTPVAPTADPATVKLDQMQRAHVIRVCEACGWRIKGPEGAAERLGLKPSTLYFRMKKLGIERPGSDRAS